MKLAKKKLMYVLQFTLMFIVFPFGFVVNLLGIPFWNFLYLSCLIIALFYFFWRKKINWFIVIFYTWIIILIILGQLNSSRLPFYNIRFLIQDIGTLSSFFVGYIVARSYSNEFIFKSLFTVSKGVTILLILSFLFMTFGITTTPAGGRFFLNTDFFSFYILLLLSPFTLYYLMQNKKNMNWYFLIILVLYVFSFRSSTRSVFIITSLSVVIGLILSRKFKFLLIIGLIIPFLIPLFSQTNLGKRTALKKFNDDARLLEARWMSNTFQKTKTNTSMGFGLGTGVLYSGGGFVSRKDKDSYVLYSHIGLLNYLWKGGIVLFLLVLYPIWKVLYYRIFMPKNKILLNHIIACQFLFYSINSLSGGYEFSSILMLGLAYGLIGKGNSKQLIAC